PRAHTAQRRDRRTRDAALVVHTLPELVGSHALEQGVDHLARVALGIDVGIQPADVGQHEPLSVRALQPDVRGRVHAHAVRDRVDLVWYARDAQTGITALERRHDPLPRIV